MLLIILLFIIRWHLSLWHHQQPDSVSQSFLGKWDDCMVYQVAPLLTNGLHKNNTSGESLIQRKRRWLRASPVLLETWPWLCHGGCLGPLNTADFKGAPKPERLQKSCTQISGSIWKSLLWSCVWVRNEGCWPWSLSPPVCACGPELWWHKSPWQIYCHNLSAPVAEWPSS